MRRVYLNLTLMGLALALAVEHVAQGSAWRTAVDGLMFASNAFICYYDSRFHQRHRP